MHHKEENRPIVFALFSPRHTRLEKKHTHRPPFNGTPELDARLRAPLAERAALTGKKEKYIVEEKQPRVRSTLHQPCHGSLRVPVTTTRRVLLKRGARRGQSLINTIVPKGQSRQSATQQPGPDFNSWQHFFSVRLNKQAQMIAWVHVH